MPGKSSKKSHASSSPSSKTSRSHKRGGAVLAPNGGPSRYITIDWNYSKSLSPLLQLIRLHNYDESLVTKDMREILNIVDPHQVMVREFAILSLYDLTRGYFRRHQLDLPGKFLSRQNYDRHRCRFVSWLLQADGGSSKDDPLLFEIPTNHERYISQYKYDADVLEGKYENLNRERALEGGSKCDEWLSNNPPPRPGYVKSIVPLTNAEASVLMDLEDHCLVHGE